MATYFAFAGASSSWLSSHGIPEQQARDYIAHIFSGLAATALEKPGQSFAALAIDHATKGGTNQQVVNRMTEQGVFKIFNEAARRHITARDRGIAVSQDRHIDFGSTLCSNGACDLSYSHYSLPRPSPPVHRT